MAEVNHFHAAQPTLSTFSSNTWGEPTNTCKISGASLSANTKYLIIATGLLSGSDISDYYSCRLSTADDANVAARTTRTLEAWQALSYVGARVGYVMSYTTDGTPADIQWEVISPSTTDGYVDSLTLTLIDLDDLGAANYIEAENATPTNLGTSLTGFATISTLADETEYLFAGYSQADTLVIARRVETVLRDGSTVKALSRVEEDDIADFTCTGLFAAWTTASTAQDADIALRSSATSSFQHEYSYLIAIKTSAFEDFGFAYTAGGSTGITSTPSVIESVGPYTPSVSGDHLYLGATTTGTSGEPSISLAQDTTHLLTDELVTYARRSDVDANHGQVTAVIASQSASKTINLYSRVPAGGSHNTDHDFVAYLNLNLVATGNDLTAAISGTATVTTELETIQNLSAAPTGTATITATLRAVNDLTAALSGTATVAVTLSNIGTNPLTAALSGTATLAIREIAAGPYRGLNSTSDALAGTVDVTEALATTVGVTDG